MGFSSILIITLIALASNLVNSQFGQRNWFDAASRMYSECLPDGSGCSKIPVTACCSLYCSGSSVNPTCDLHPCGCPQPVYSEEPIMQHCSDYGSSCRKHYERCSGFCYIAYGVFKCSVIPMSLFQPCA